MEANSIIQISLTQKRQYSLHIGNIQERKEIWDQLSQSGRVEDIIDIVFYYDVT